MAYASCPKCNVVHKYVHCPVCNFVDPNCHVRCPACRKVCRLADACDQCGAAILVSPDTRRRDPTHQPWRLPLQTILVAIGAAIACLNGLPYLAYPAAAVAALMASIAANELYLTTKPKANCPNCNAVLRSKKASQCFDCGHDGHGR